jgi:tetratricopeptide repeat protein
VIERFRGNVDAARELASRTLDAAQRTEMLEYVVQARAVLAWVAWREGDHDRAEELARSARESWDEILNVLRVLAWMPTWPLLGVALARGDEADAVEHARVIVDPTRQPMPPDLESVLDQAVAAWDRGDADGARASLSAAAQVAAGYGYL